eukprot:2416568-Alexandrium_andersonii.AAC.1
MLSRFGGQACSLRRPSTALLGRGTAPSTGESWQWTLRSCCVSNRSMHPVRGCTGSAGAMERPAWQAALGVQAAVRAPG